LFAVIGVPASKKGGCSYDQSTWHLQLPRGKPRLRFSGAVLLMGGWRSSSRRGRSWWGRDQERSRVLPPVLRRFLSLVIIARKSFKHQLGKLKPAGQRWERSRGCPGGGEGGRARGALLFDYGRGTSRRRRGKRDRGRGGYHPVQRGDRKKKDEADGAERGKRHTVQTQGSSSGVPVP